MTKRAKTAKTARTTPAIVKSVKKATSMPVLAKAATAIPGTTILLALGACAVGALAMFLFDSASGQRRRELIRDKALQASRDVSETISKGSRDVRHRLESVAIETGKRLRGERSSDGISGGQGDVRMGQPQGMRA